MHKGREWERQGQREAGREKERGRQDRGITGRCGGTGFPLGGLRRGQAGKALLPNGTPESSRNPESEQSDATPPPPP